MMIPSLRNIKSVTGGQVRHLAAWADPTEEDSLSHPAVDVFAAGLRHHHTANTAYPIAHEKTTKPYRVARERSQVKIQDTLVGAYGSLKEMMLYVHVPFCAQRCQFCEYTVVDPKQGSRDNVQNKYFDTLLNEFDQYRNLLGTEKKRLVGFDIGGGTPSMASIQNIERVMQKAMDCYDFDHEETAVSIETTPKIAANEPEKIKAYFDMGIRRISMGVQTTDFALAERLGRHDGDYLVKARDNVRAAGFESFNIDLMYGFPLRDKSEDKWANTVRNTIQVLEPDHITLYRMRYKGTKMAHLQERVGLQQVNKQSETATRILDEAGFHGWVGKNTFSRTPGSSGCSDYLEKRVLEGTPYVGLGLGAQSFSHSTLAYNLGGVTKRMEQYHRSVELGRLPIQDLYHLSKSGAMGKFCSVSFYFGGIHLAHFKRNFGVQLEHAFPEQVEFVLGAGLMEYDKATGRLAMTLKGKQGYGGVLALFYAPHVQGHLLSLQGGEDSALAYLTSAAAPSSKSSSRVETTEKMRGALGMDIPRAPYRGNPRPRYERRRLKRQDSRPALPDDWTESIAQ